MDYSSVLFSVLGDLGKGVLVIGAFYFGCYMGLQYKSKCINYVVVLGAIGFFSLALWSSYGTHIEDADPVYGGGITVIDSEPTDKARNEYGWTTFLTLSIPALFGVYRKQKTEKRN